MNIDKINKDFLEYKIDKNKYKKLMHDFYINLDYLASLMGQSDVGSLHIENSEIIAEIINTPYSNLKLYFDVVDIGSPIAEMINFGHFEKEYSLKLIEAIESANIFFDIGANIGYYSLIAESRNNNADIFAFEPIPQTYERFLKNISLNSTKRINTYNFGFLEKEKDINMYFNDRETTAASLENIRETENARKTLCKFLTLDSFVEQSGNTPDLIKIDVEGAELFTLKGATRTLSSTNPTIFIEILRKWCEKFGHTAMDVFTFLYELGYSSYIVRKNELIEITSINQDTVDSNFVFKKKS